MADERRLLGIFAHPDDEMSMGGCLMQYAARGARVYVACATRGDGVDAQIKNAAATRATLGQVRAQELACACEAMGIEPPQFLGFQDGEVDQVPLEVAARQVARLIRELQPHVVVTHGPEGGYGHPDHIAVSHFTTRGCAWAADPTAPDLDLPAFAPSKLYYTAMPRSFLEKLPAFQQRRADIRGQKLGFVGVPDEAITTAIEVNALLRAKLQALSCHRTQFDFDPETNLPKSFWTAVPEPQRSQFFGYERFVLTYSTVGQSEGLESDLFARL